MKKTNHATLNRKKNINVKRVISLSYLSVACEHVHILLPLYISSCHLDFAHNSQLSFLYTTSSLNNTYNIFIRS